MRTTKKEREANAKNFYQTFMHGNCKKAAILIERWKSKNQNESKCRFWTVESQLAYMSKPVVIAESNIGIEGCFIEFFKFIKGGPQKTFYESGFKEWIKNEFGFEITFEDGLIFMFERCEEECYG